PRLGGGTTLGVAAAVLVRGPARGPLSAPVLAEPDVVRGPFAALPGHDPGTAPGGGGKPEPGRPGQPGEPARRIRCPVRNVSTVSPSRVLWSVIAPCGQVPRKQLPRSVYGSTIGVQPRVGPWHEITTRGRAHAASSGVLAVRPPWWGAM